MDARKDKSVNSMQSQEKLVERMGRLKERNTKKQNTEYNTGSAITNFDRGLEGQR